jgi:hypothetical protein
VTRDRWPFETVIRDLVAALADQDYLQLERRTSGVRLSAAELASAVGEYGRSIIVPPDDSTSFIDVVPVFGAEPRVWSVNVSLWTLEDGLSDLTLELTVRASASGEYVVEIDDLHVL